MLKGEIKAVAPYGDTITNLKVNFAPEQSSTPSLMPETNSVYLTRPTEGTGELMELVGGTVAWNQLIQNGNFASLSNWTKSNNNITGSVSDNVLTVTCTTSGDNRYQQNYVSADGHKVLFHIDAKTDTPGTNNKQIYAYFGSASNSYISPGASDTNWHTHIGIKTMTGTSLMQLRLQNSVAGVTNQYRNAYFVDLTSYLTPAIADYVYSLEQATAGSGIQWLQSYGFFTEDYIAYSTPTLQSVEATAHVTKGKNLMNPDWAAWTAGNLYAVLADVVPKGEVARITLEDNDTSVSLSGCNMGFVYEDTGSTATQYRWAIANGVVQSNVTNISVVDSATLCSNVFIYPKTEETLNKLLARYNIMVELGTTATDYTPYHAPTTYPLANITLRGIPMKDADGNLYYDGDTYEWDGTVTRYFGERAYQAGDESLTDAITDGTNTVYKLTTPTTESADPYTAMQTVEDGGTEEFVTTNGVPVGVVGRFANAVPMEGVDSFSVTANDGTSHTYPVSLSEEIYRGYVDMLTGEAISEAASIAEYNGETISEPWLSSLDVYVPGATPTKGAQVVYPITPEEVTATITGDPTELGDVTSVTSTKGTVKWGNMVTLGLMPVITLADPFE